VHKRGGVLFLQICHGGRVSAPEINGGVETWAPSAIEQRADKNHFIKGAESNVPKEMTLEDIRTVQE